MGPNINAEAVQQHHNNNAEVQQLNNNNVELTETVFDSLDGLFDDGWFLQGLSNEPIDQTAKPHDSFNGYFNLTNENLLSDYVEHSGDIPVEFLQLADMDKSPGVFSESCGSPQEDLPSGDLLEDVCKDLGLGTVNLDYSLPAGTRNGFTITPQAKNISLKVPGCETITIIDPDTVKALECNAFIHDNSLEEVIEQEKKKRMKNNERCKEYRKRKKCTMTKEEKVLQDLEDVNKKLKLQEEELNDKKTKLQDWYLKAIASGKIQMTT